MFAPPPPSRVHSFAARRRLLCQSCSNMLLTVPDVLGLSAARVENRHHFRRCRKLRICQRCLFPFSKQPLTCRMRETMLSSQMLSAVYIKTTITSKILEHLTLKILSVHFLRAYNTLCYLKIPLKGRFAFHERGCALPMRD